MLPLLLAGAVAASIEKEAWQFYLDRVTRLDTAWMDKLILAVGTVLFLLQIVLAYRALRWRGNNFDERPDPWLNNLAQAAEWFPLLGLLGTVAAILQTFSQITTFTPKEIIQSYAPAITATGTGLFMALINIFPTWMVPVGRDLIRTLGGEEPTPAKSVPPLPAARSETVRPTQPHARTDTGS
jgi:hypothetical protein